MTRDSLGDSLTAVLDRVDVPGAPSPELVIRRGRRRTARRGTAGVALAVALGVGAWQLTLPTTGVAIDPIGSGNEPIARLASPVEALIYPCAPGADRCASLDEIALLVGRFEGISVVRRTDREELDALDDDLPMGVDWGLDALVVAIAPDLDPAWWSELADTHPAAWLTTDVGRRHVSEVAEGAILGGRTYPVDGSDQSLTVTVRLDEGGVRCLTSDAGSGCTSIGSTSGGTTHVGFSGRTLGATAQTDPTGRCAFVEGASDLGSATVTLLDGRRATVEASTILEPFPARLAVWCWAPDEYVAEIVVHDRKGAELARDTYGAPPASLIQPDGEE